MANIQYYDVILKPVVTEKSMNAMSEKKYTFLRKINLCFYSRIASGVNNFTSDYFFNCQMFHTIPDPFPWMILCSHFAEAERIFPRLIHMIVSFY